MAVTGYKAMAVTGYKATVVNTYEIVEFMLMLTSGLSQVPV